MTSRDQGFKRLCDFMGGSFSLSCYLTKFGGHGPCDSRDIVDLIFHMALQDHKIKASCDFMEGDSLLHIPFHASLIVISIAIVNIS